MLVLAVVAVGQLFRIDNIVWKFYTNPILLEFALGIALSMLYRRYSDIFAKSSGYLIAIFAVAFAAKLLLPAMNSIWASAIPVALLVAIALSLPNARTQAASFLVLLGDASYSLYLSHPYVLQLWVKATPDGLGVPVQIIAGTAVCVVALAVSVAMYRLIERPTQKFLLGIARQKPVSASVLPGR